MTDVLVTGDITLQGTFTGTLQTNVAILADIKSSGTNGGTSLTTGTQDRTLNTLIDPDGILTLDSGNIEFSFNETGNYYVEALVPGYKTRGNKAYLTYSNNTVISIGSSDWTTYQAIAPSAKYCSNSILNHVLQVSSTSQNYKIRQYTRVGVATLGLGVAASSGEDEQYTTVTVIKLS